MIYLDHAATTAVSADVFAVMEPYLKDSYFNASAHYQAAYEVRKAVEHARKQTADLIGALPEEIYFTSGGTESDNWAIRSAVYGRKNAHIITSCIEHPAVLKTCRQLEKEGAAVTYLGVDHSGLVSPAALKQALRDNTVLVSIMAANNVIGTIEPIAQLCEITHEAGALFHTDAVAAVSHMPVDVREWNVDLLSAGGHKFHAPKGIGFLYIRRGCELEPFQYGAAQENGMRPGTLNVPGIIGLGKASECAKRSLEQNERETARLRDHLAQRVLQEIPGAVWNGNESHRLSCSLNLSFPHVNGSALLEKLDEAGICASSGIAGFTKKPGISYVLSEIGLPDELAAGSVRITISEENTMEEMDRTAEVLKAAVSALHGRQ